MQDFVPNYMIVFVDGEDIIEKFFCENEPSDQEMVQAHYKMGSRMYTSVYTTKIEDGGDIE